MPFYGAADVLPDKVVHESGVRTTAASGGYWGDSREVSQCTGPEVRTLLDGGEIEEALLCPLPQVVPWLRPNDDGFQQLRAMLSADYSYHVSGNLQQTDTPNDV